MFRSRQANRHVAWILAALALGSTGCAHAPAAQPDSTILWGYVRLVPKSGSQAGGGSYGDRRVSSVKRVDYSQMKFAVVFAPGDRNEGAAPAELVIREVQTGPSLEPRYAATSPTGGIRVTNETTTSQIVSVPGAARLERIAAGESMHVRDLPLGETPIHLLGVPDHDAAEPSQVWVTEGITAEVDATGRYTLRGLAPGAHSIRAWHPRLPPSPNHDVELALGSAVRLDLEIGLDAVAHDLGETR